MARTGASAHGVDGDGSAGSRYWLGLLGATTLALALPYGVLAAERPAQMAQATSQRTAIAIPPQELDTALTALGRQTGLRLLFTSDRVAGLRSGGLNGSYTPEEALQQLLLGTGLTYAFTAGDTATVVPIADSRGAQTLGPITVLGSRRLDAPLSSVPSSITTVERHEIQKELPTAGRVADVLARRVPGFNPTNNGVRQIRGRTAQVFINGAPVNEQLRASSASDLNLLSPDQLAGVEVSRGANSAYGFGSPGGIIALQTPRAESEELTLRSVVRDSFNPQQAGDSHQTSVYQSAAQIVGRFDYHVGGALAYDGREYDPDGDLALGLDNSALLGNGEEVLGNLDGSFGYDLGDAGRLRLTGTYGYVDFQKRYSFNPGVQGQTYGSLTEDPAGDRSFRQSYTLNLSYENDSVLGSAVKVEAFTSSVETEVYSSFDGVTERDEQTNEYYGVRSAITTPLHFAPDGTAVTYGLDLLRNRYFRPYYNDDTGQLITYFSPDVTLDSFAPYAQLEVPVGDFLLSGGIRREEYRGHVETATGSGGIDGGDIRDFGLTLFNAGIVYFVDRNIELFGTFSQGAEITQLGRAARDAASADEVDPEPAKSNQYEIGVRGEWKGLKLGLASFYTESDLLSALVCDGINPCTPLREPRDFWGVEANGDWRIDEQWGIGGILTWQDGIRETEDGDTRRIGSRDMPPVLLSGYVDYSPFKWWRNTLQVDYRGSRDPFGDSTAYGEGQVEDVFLLHLSAAFDVGPGVLQLGVRNLLNEEYVSIPGEADNLGFLYIPEQGTRVSASYSVKW